MNYNKRGSMAKNSVLELVPSLVKKEKLYVIWPFGMVVVGFINIIASAILGSDSIFSSAIQNGQVYLFSLSICTPFMVTQVLNNFINVRKEEKSHCQVLKSYTSIINFIVIFISVLLWCGKYKDNTIWQGIILLVAIGLSFFMFCLDEVEKHPDILPEWDDDNYIYKEQERMDEILKKSKDINEIKGEGRLKL